MKTPLIYWLLNRDPAENGFGPTVYFFSLGFHEKPWKLLRRNFLGTIHILRTGYSLSDQHILPPINPKYDDWFCQDL